MRLFEQTTADGVTPVESIIGWMQNALLGLSRGNESIPRVNPDGVYGPRTAEAVKAFQYYVGLPATGKADNATFTKITESYYSFLANNNPPACISPFTRRLSVRRALPEDYFDLIKIIQHMLRTISIAYDLGVIEETGEFDMQTAIAISRFQRMNLLPTTGYIDRQTWNRLAVSYNKFVDSE